MRNWYKPPPLPSYEMWLILQTTEDGPVGEVARFVAHTPRASRTLTKHAVRAMTLALCERGFITPARRSELDEANRLAAKLYASFRRWHKFGHCAWIGKFSFCSIILRTIGDETRNAYFELQSIQLDEARRSMRIAWAAKIASAALKEGAAIENLAILARFDARQRWFAARQRSTASVPWTPGLVPIDTEASS